MHTYIYIRKYTRMHTHQPTNQIVSTGFNIALQKAMRSFPFHPKQRDVLVMKLRMEIIFAPQNKLSYLPIIRSWICQFYQFKRVMIVNIYYIALDRKSRRFIPVAGVLLLLHATISLVIITLMTPVGDIHSALFIIATVNQFDQSSQHILAFINTAAAVSNRRLLT